MPPHDDYRFPKLRPTLDVRSVTHRGQPYVSLRDPLQLSGQNLFVPQALAPVLSLCDGSRDEYGLRTSAAIRYGLRLESEELNHLMAVLDEALMLDNPRFTAAHAEALEAYRQGEFRPPNSAEISYPDNADDLRQMLEGYLDGVDSGPPQIGVRGLVSPHIDFLRGGAVYARLWQGAAEAVRQAELAIILGTDHYGHDEHPTLTRQNYATPYGILPTDLQAVGRLVEDLGAETAFQGELRHAGEHSIELAAVWLHHMRAGKPIDVLPVLCGSLAGFSQDGVEPGDDPLLSRFLEALREVAANNETVIIAAGDLAHVGPAFGGLPLDADDKARLEEVDGRLIERMCSGDAPGFFAEIMRANDSNNVCGLAPIYYALESLKPTHGERIAYEQCPADTVGSSLVSICGVLLK